MFDAMRLASSFDSNFAADCRPGSSDQWINRLRLAVGFVASNPLALTPSEVTAACRGAMNIEKFEGEGWRTIWLAIAGVLAITLTWNVLMLSLNGISY